MTGYSLDVQAVKTIAEQTDFAKLKNKRLLISGGTGFIGSVLLDVFAYRNRVYGDNIRAVVISRRGGTNTEYVEYKAHDVTVPLDVECKLDYVLHLASNTHPQQYRQDPVGTITANIYGCDNLLKIAAEHGARFLLASSVEIYGNGAQRPITEDYCGYIDCNTARAGYNEAKRTCESLCRSYQAQYSVDAVTARLSRVFGADTKDDTKAIAQFIGKAVRGEDIVLNSSGKQRFSYCYVADAAAGLLKVLTDGNSGEAYNIAAEDDGETLGGYAKYIAELGKVKCVFDIRSDPGASNAEYAVLDCSKLKSLGWSPIYTVKDGLKRTVEILKTSERFAAGKA